MAEISPLRRRMITANVPAVRDSSLTMISLAHEYADEAARSCMAQKGYALVRKDQASASCLRGSTWIAAASLKHLIVFRAGPPDSWPLTVQPIEFEPLIRRVSKKVSAVARHFAAETANAPMPADG
jgi:hypothetical protein